MLTDEKIRELATLYIVEKNWNTIPEHDANDNLGMWYARCKLAYIAGANAAREEMMKDRKEKTVSFAEWIDENGFYYSMSHGWMTKLEHGRFAGKRYDSSDLYDIFEKDKNK